MLEGGTAPSDAAVVAAAATAAAAAAATDATFTSLFQRTDPSGDVFSRQVAALLHLRQLAKDTLTSSRLKALAVTSTYFK